MLYKIIYNLMPNYIIEPTPNLNQSKYNLRKGMAYLSGAK